MPHQDSTPREAKPRQGGADRPLLDLFSLRGHTIIISGGGGGLGTTVADSVLECGGNVVCLDLAPEPSHAPWKTLQSKASDTKAQLIYHQCDVTSSESVVEVFLKLKGALGAPIRGLVACVGQSDTGPSIDYPASDFLRILNINIMGTYIVAQATARAMKAENVDGAMVLVASMSGWVANKGADSSAYNTAKCGIHQLGRSLASEWGSRVDMPLIRVNTISPGYIKTAATVEALANQGMEERWSEQNMLNRISFPDEFRGPIMFLLSDASSFMTAADLTVDGGHRSW
ncbi:uncharacterized protein N7496_002276 [Penicillium cataractarum]|uniref:Uncharacterized protein n=1 Tax=Penicillium cataractarum TaxID=2100454 RepID=A0A9W9SJU0_9EURO|nr:uncharacterized protein N7496_002276 [Penicillium cataractarum]KAJ5379848.1 hypothetical protein N7496_002276 [Penicillium cataractarum]